MPDFVSGAGLLGGVLSAGSAKSASNSQERAGREQVALARETRDLNRADLAPFLQGGLLGQQAYLSEMGLGAAPMIGGTAPQINTITGTPTTYTTGSPDGPQTSTRPGVDSFQVGGQTFGTMDEAQAWANANKTGGTAYQGFQKTPGYDFQLGQGMDALQSTAAARGGLMSGSTMRAAQGYGQGLANQEYGNYMNRLAGLSSQGQSSAAMQADNNNNYAQMGTNALAGIGNAQAAGAIGVGNAINGGLQNAIGAWQYQKTQQPQQQQQSNWTGLW